jgi:hypothetical protein
MNALMTLREVLLAIYRQLIHPGVGVPSALLTALLCGAGNVLLKFVPHIHHLHLGAYWLPTPWHTIWVFALLATVSVWCAHAVLELIHVVAAKTGSSALWLALAVPQAVLALAVGCCVWLEIRPSEERFLILDTPVDVHGESYRALRVEASSRIRGHRRPLVAWLERKVGATTDRIRAQRWQPWASASGTYRIALDRADMATHGVVLRHGREHVELATNQPVRSGADTLVLHGVQNPDSKSEQATPKADVSIGSHRVLLPLDPEWTGETALLGLKESPVLVLHVRKNVTSLLTALGIASCLGGIALMIQSAFRSSRSR